jgi:hypothetical protein
VSSYREPISKKKQNLGYLCEDLERKISKIRDWNDEDEVEPYRLNEANILISEIGFLDIGFEIRLNDLQYCLGGDADVSLGWIRALPIDRRVHSPDS